MRNGLTIGLAVVIFVWLYRTMGIDGMLYIGEAGLGLGFLIFVHELGHFLVAKWCDVHVETFSIGFGPAIPGCSFQRGETFYKVAWFPLGGYVKMVGEGPEEDEHEDDPRSFKNKPVWQRMAIISAGVVMNTLTAFLLFIIVFMTRGAEMRAGLIGAVDCGSPAWQQGVHSGARIVQINDIRDPYFNDVMEEIMTTRASQALSIVYEYPNGSGKDLTVRIEPRREEDDIKPVVGIMEPVDLVLVDKPIRSEPTPAVQQSAAADAVPPFAFGDKIISTTDPEHAEALKPIANDYGEFYRRLCLLKAQPMVVRVERKGRDGHDEMVDVKVPAQGASRLGLRMRMGHVTAIRENSPALKAGVEARNLPAGSEGDIIKEVELPEPDGTRTRYVTSRENMASAAGVTVKDLDPERLPFDLAQWAARRKAGAEITLVVLRPVAHAARGPVPLKAGWDDSYRFDREVPFGANSPLSIPGLGLAYRIDNYVEAVEPASPAEEAGMRAGDLVKAIRFRGPGKKAGENTPSSWAELHDDQWAFVFWSMQRAEFKEFDLRIERGKKTEEVTLRAVPDLTWPQVERGLHLMPAIRYQKADSPVQAVVLGLHMSANTIRRILQTLDALLISRRISWKGIGGPIEIGYAAYRTAEEGIFSFLQLMAVISINLAVINFLPIPVLDGGHMVFLGYELVRGRPASEQVRVIATYAGLLLILSLMVFVIFRGVTRLL